MKLFDQESLIYKWLMRFYEIVAVNLCLVICSLPIVTIGPSIAAMYSVLFKIRAGEDVNILKVFKQSFIENFKQSFIIWNAILFVSLWIIYCIGLFAYSDIQFFHVYAALLGVLQFILVVYSLFVFPLISQFHNTLKNTIINGFMLMFKHFGTTFVIIMLYVTVGLLLFYNEFTLAIGFSCFLSFGISLLSYTSCIYFEKIFDYYKLKKAME